MPDGRTPTSSLAGPSAILAFLSSGMVVAILYFARDIIVPITLAVLLSFLLSPAVRWLRRLRIGRVAAVMLTGLVAFVVILGFGAIVVQEISSLARDLPAYRSNIETKVQSLPEMIPGGGVIRRAAAMLSELRSEFMRPETPSPAPAEHTSRSDTSVVERPRPVPVEIRQPDLEPLQLVQSIIGPMLQPLASGGLVIVFVFMILLDREDLRDRLLRLAGRRDLHRTTEAMNDAAQRVSRYLLRQLVVNVTCGLPIGVGLTVIGIPNAALWGIFVVLLRFIPYLGIVIAAGFPLALAIAVDPGWTLLLWTILLFVVIELVVTYLVEPWVYGAGTGLSPVALIAAAIFWTWLWGPIGLLLSTPLTACLVVVGRHVPHLRFLDVILGNEPVLTPEETFYQRLLANDPAEATEQAEEWAKERSFAEFCDEIAIPALARIQTDSDHGAVSAEHRAKVEESIAAMLDNLSDDAIDDASATPEHTTGPMSVIHCVAGRNELDGAAALLLTHLLRLNNHVVIEKNHVVIEQVLATDVLASNAASPKSSKDATLICLSLISTSAPARARYLARRVRRRAPRAKVLVGLWGLSAEALADAQATIGTSADGVAASLRDAVTTIHAHLNKSEAASLDQAGEGVAGG
jgi:predicted PurR-regulated permease PerM